jgi:hypothetical protein
MLTIEELITPSDLQWRFVIREMRNSWESQERSDSTDYPFEMGAADMALCRKLINAGADHAKFMRQLPLHIAVSAPSYWWREFDTYRVGIEAGDVTANSTSQMHTVGRHAFTADMFSMEDMSEYERAQILNHLNALRNHWIDCGKRKGPDARPWRALVQAIPDSWQYRRGVSLNYANARAIYHARRAHRLSEWRQFCAALADVPYGWMIAE